MALTQESLISIKKASQILGVNEATLRQWTNEGKLKAFITPGGHRRYSRRDLEKFMKSSQKMLGIKDLVVELEDTIQLHRKIARTHLNTTACYRKISEESQEHLADLGRQLLKLIVRYVTEPSKQEETIKLARDIGFEHGDTLAKLGLPLKDSVEAFILHRDTVMSAATNMITKKEPFNRRVVIAIPLADHIMDEALLSMVAAHQRYHNERSYSL
jgi:excisionase family DNA binding protein